MNAVINLNHVASEKYDLIEDEARQLKEALGDTTLKVIIESKILEDEQKANLVIRLENANVDYIKTSTGFETINKIPSNGVCLILFIISAMIFLFLSINSNLVSPGF